MLMLILMLGQIKLKGKTGSELEETFQRNKPEVDAYVTPCDKGDMRGL